MDEKRAKELFADGAFVKSLFALEPPEEVQAAVKAKGLDITLDEINAVKESLAKSAKGELSDADLEKVAGGFVNEVMSLIEVFANMGATGSRW